MTPKEIGTLSATVLVTLLTLAILDDKTPEAKVTDKAVGYSKLAVLPDAGKAYVIEVEVTTDAGVEVKTLITKTPGCVRKMQDKDDCSRIVDSKPVDFGVLNRFPANEAVGADCKPVACSVYLGENADEDEDARLIREKEAAK